MNKLDICKSTRKIAANSVYNVLKEVLKSSDPISEVQFRDRLLRELRKYKEILQDGWYDPPPRGIGVIFGTPQDANRINFPTLRDEEYWPRKDVFLDRNDGLIVVYISPVAKEQYIIGDFGLNIYLGKNQKIIDHIKNVYTVVQEVFSQASITMQLSEFYELEAKIFEKHNLINSGWISISDPTKINTGHTIPSTDVDWTPEEKKILSNTSDWQKVCSTISKKRRFVNAIETTKITNNMAFTIEPRLASSKDTTLPKIYFHTIALFKENGEKELLTNFDEIFKLVGMDYMLN